MVAAGSEAVEAVSVRHAAWIALCLGRAERAPVGPDDDAALARQVGEDHYAGGTTVFRLGQLPARVHILRHATVELSRQIGGRRVVLQILRVGDVFGDIAALVGMREPFDARAVEDSVVLSIDTEALFGLLAARPRLARRWLVSVAQRMAEVQARLVDLLAGGLEAQLASVLVREAEHGTVRLSQAMLGKLVGCQRTSVNRVLKQLGARGLVAPRYRQVTVLRPRGLAQLGAAALTAPTPGPRPPR